MNTRFIELAGEINTFMPEYVIHKLSEALNSIGKAINGSKILVLGLGYKKNIDDLRESPSLFLIDKLIRKGGSVGFVDPFFNKIPRTRKFNNDVVSKNLSPSTLNDADIVLLATDHDVFDYKMILDHSRLIVDTRGRFQKSKK